MSNGDRNFNSGAVTREPFSLATGLTVEVWGRMPFDGRHYQGWTVELVPDIPDADSTDWRDPVRLLNLALAGSEDRVTLGVIQEAPVYLPPPTDTESWHLYALQVDQRGTVSLVIDKKLYWQSRQPIDTDRDVHVDLAGRSIGAEIMHGPVRVYRGVKYVLGGVRR